MTTMQRMDPNQGLVRGVRAAVLTVPTVGGAALAHSLVDGCASWTAILLAAGLCWPAAVALLGAKRRLTAFVTWVLIAQVATHVLLEQMCGDVTSGQSSLAHHLATGLTGTMLLAHGLAVVSTSALLGRADAGLWAADALIRRASRPPRLTVPVSLVLTTAPALPSTDDVPAPRTTWVAAQPARRGPPVLLALAS